MGFKHTIVVGVICAAVMIGAQYYGSAVYLGYFIIIGAVGVVGTILYARRHDRATRVLRGLDKPTQDAVLLALEQTPERPALAEDAGLSQPVVPIRGGREVFRYPTENVAVARWLSRGYLFMAGFFALGWASDAAMGTMRFADPAVTPWWESVLLIGGFGVVGILMHRSAVATAQVLEITDEGIAWIRDGATVRTIAWDDVTDAGSSPLVDRLWVRRGRTTIAVSNRLIGFGRVVNLVASRAAARSRWRSA